MIIKTVDVNISLEFELVESSDILENRKYSINSSGGGRGIKSY